MPIETTVERADSTWAPDVIDAIRGHYTGSRGPPPGKKMVWRAFYGNSEPFAYLGIGEPSYKLSPRRRLGIEDARPLPRTVNNFIFRRIDEGAVPVRGSEILRAWKTIAAIDWADRYGWQPVHWETMILPDATASPVAGAAYRCAGWRSLGWTTGRGARRPPGSTHGARIWGKTAPKLVMYLGPLERLAVSEISSLKMRP